MSMPANHGNQRRKTAQLRALNCFNCRSRERYLQPSKSWNLRQAPAHRHNKGRQKPDQCYCCKKLSSFVIVSRSSSQDRLSIASIFIVSTAVTAQHMPSSLLFLPPKACRGNKVLMIYGTEKVPKSLFYF